MAFRARDTRKLVLAGPVDLMQGGQGFIGRFRSSSATGRLAFWGVVSAVVDADRLYRDSGLLDPQHGLEIALRGEDGVGPAGRVFFGPAAVLDDQPVTADVQLPGGSWQILALPRQGWGAALPDPTIFRLIIGLASGLVLAPLFFARHLINERARHIRALGERQHQLDVLSRRLGLALSTSEVGVWEYNADLDRLVWDDRMNELYGQPRNAGARAIHHWSEAVHPDDLARARDEFEAALRNRGRYVSDFRVRLADGTERHIRAIGTCYREADGSARVVGVNWDVTADVAIKHDLERARAMAEARNAELLAATARIEHTSLHDALTRLPNRRYLDRVLEERAAACADNGGGLALLHIDLDRFKEINDTLGHAAGDAMLVHAPPCCARTCAPTISSPASAATSSSSSRRCAMAARPAVSRAASSRPCATPFPMRGMNAAAASRSASPISAAQGRRQAPLMDADIALYRAKRRGANRHEFFTEALQAEIVSTKRMADDILAGIEQGQFVAWYQPQIDARTKAVCGVEALAAGSIRRAGSCRPTSSCPSPRSSTSSPPSTA